MSQSEAMEISGNCAHPKCTCDVTPDEGVTIQGNTYCNARCADPGLEGCGHEGCPCGETAET